MLTVDATKSYSSRKGECALAWCGPGRSDAESRSDAQEQKLRDLMEYVGTRLGGSTAREGLRVA